MVCFQADRASPAASQQPSSSSGTAQQPAQPAVIGQQQVQPAVATSQAQSAVQQPQPMTAAQTPQSSAALGPSASQPAPAQQTAPSDVILVSRYLSLCESTLSTENGFRIFCAVLALLQPAHAQGVSVQCVRPSQLLLHRSGQVTTQRDLPPSVRETELYASPEELASGCSTPASDIFSMGMLFFELLNPIQDAQARSRVLAEVRRRVLPVSLGQHRPHETAFLLALLHPEASKRPTVAQIIGSNLLNMLRSSVHQHPAVHANSTIPHQQQMLAQQQKVAEEQHRRQQHAWHQEQSGQNSRHAQQQEAQQQLIQPLAGVDSETLLDFLKVMQQTTVNALGKSQHQLSFLDKDIQEVNTAILMLQCHQGASSDESTSELLQQSSAPERMLLSSRQQEPLELQHPASRKRHRSWEPDSAESSLSASGSLSHHVTAQQSQADSKRERIQQSCQIIDRAFGELERKFFQQRELPNGQTGNRSPDVSDSSHVDLPGLANLSDHLADFSTDLIDFSRYSQLKVHSRMRTPCFCSGKMLSICILQIFCSQSDSNSICAACPWLCSTHMAIHQMCCEDALCAVK